MAQSIPRRLYADFYNKMCQQATFHFGRLAQRAAGLVFRNLSLAAYHRQH